MQIAAGYLAELGLSFQIVAKPYTPALQDILMMEALDRANIPPLDWVIVADTDELYNYGYSHLAAVVAQMDISGASYALGEMLDHVARNGSLATLQVQTKHGDSQAKAKLFLITQMVRLCFLLVQTANHEM